jgi:hypothetical protein
MCNMSAQECCLRSETILGGLLDCETWSLLEGKTFFTNVWGNMLIKVF